MEGADKSKRAMATLNGRHPTGRWGTTRWGLIMGLVILLTAALLPSIVAAAPFGYITNENQNTVSVIDITTNAVVATVRVGKTPIGVALSPDGTRAYVANASSHTVSVINTATNSVIANVRVPSAPVGIVVSPDRSRAYLLHGFFGNTVSVINTATNTINGGVCP